MHKKGTLMKVDWKNGLLDGVIYFLVIYVVATALVAYKVNPQSNIYAWILVTLVTLATGYILAVRLKVSSMSQGLVYGFIWLAVTLVLDLLITIPFTGISFFQNWQFWFGLVLTVFLPGVSFYVHMLVKK
jgi:hypothetical protein